MILRRLIDLLLRLARRLVRILAAFEVRMGGLDESSDKHLGCVIRSTMSHDMYGDPDEQYYRKQYWHWIECALNESKISTGGLGLDLGCGQGRLATLLARYLHQGSVFGIDISEAAIAQARVYAEKEGVCNAVYQADDILEVLECSADKSVDVILMTEVTFFYPEWRAALDEIKRVLKPGGIVCAAFRPLYYNAMSLAGIGMFEQADMLLASRSGNLFGGAVRFTWQTSVEIAALLRDEMGMELPHLVGIGCCSGIEGDPHACLVRPSRLDDKDANDLMKLELAMAKEVPDAGRYILAIARKAQL
ncbi:MAG: class I SAM-dependent methyltransferase [Sulfuricella sp.]|nr:class I SAM-dependent methyltransferase [Sulfuricella sp.]